MVIERLSRFGLITAVLLIFGVAHGQTDNKKTPPIRDGHRSVAMIKELLEDAKSCDPVVRVKAVETLYGEAHGEKPLAEAVRAAVRECFLTALKDEQAKIRGYAVKGLGQRGETDKRVLGAVVNTFEKDRDPYVRVQAAIAIGNIGSTSAKAAIPSLRRAVTSDKNEEVRIHACSALAQTRTADKYGFTTDVDESVVKTLVGVLQNDKSLRVRGAALTSLNFLGGITQRIAPEIVDVLHEAAKEPSFSKVANKLLGKMKLDR